MGRHKQMADNFWYQVWGPPQQAGKSSRPLRDPARSVIGEYPTTDDAEWLRTIHGVTAVVSLQDDADLASKGLRLHDLERSYRTHGVGFPPRSRTRLPTMTSSPPGSMRTVRLLHEILSCGGRVYLHCNAGMKPCPDHRHSLPACVHRAVTVRGAGLRQGAAPLRPVHARARGALWRSVAKRQGGRLERMTALKGRPSMSPGIAPGEFVGYASAGRTCRVSISAACAKAAASG